MKSSTHSSTRRTLPLGAAALAALLVAAAGARAESVLEKIPAKLVNAQGGEVDRDEALKGKTIGLYFSAHWCPPCRTFTPSLVDFRNKNAEAFEVVFISFDRSREDQDKYMKDAKMEWPAIPMDNEAGKALAEHFGVRGIPSLIILDGEGNTLSTQGRNEVSEDPEGALAKWKKDS